MDILGVLFVFNWGGVDRLCEEARSMPNMPSQQVLVLNAGIIYGRPVLDDSLTPLPPRFLKLVQISIMADS